MQRMTPKEVAFEAAYAAVEAHLKRWVATANFTPKERMLYEGALAYLKDNKDIHNLTRKVLIGELAKTQLVVTLAGKLVTPFGLVTESHYVACAVAIVEAVTALSESTAMWGMGPLGVLAWTAIFIYEGYGVTNSCQPIFGEDEPKMSLKTTQLRLRLEPFQVALLQNHPLGDLSLAQNTNQSAVVRKAFRWKVT